MTEDPVLSMLYCPYCADPITPVDEDVRPGVVYCCLDGCASVSVVTDTLTLRFVTAADIRAQSIRVQREIIEMQRLQYVRARRALLEKGVSL